MQITMFKGLLPVNLPDNWFGVDDDAIRFAQIGIAQAIDFRAVGGKAIKFWISGDGVISQHWEEITYPDNENIKWTKKPFAISSRMEIKMYGQSQTVLDLKSVFSQD
jgi:hypothetical protein